MERQVGLFFQRKECDLYGNNDPDTARSCKQFEVNVIGHITVTQAFLPLLRKAQGHLINISAPTGQVAIP